MNGGRKKNTRELTRQIGVVHRDATWVVELGAVAEIKPGGEQGKGVDPSREVLPMDDSANNGRAPGHPNGKDRIRK